MSRLIKGMRLKEAESQMRHVLKKNGMFVAYMLRRVQNNLRHNYAKDPEDFIIQRSIVGKGTYRKAIKIHGRGRFGKITHPKAHLKIELKECKPLSKEEQEMEKLMKYFRRHNLFLTMKDTKPVQSLYPVWSRKPWKYNTSPRWVCPSNALQKIKED